MTVLACCGLVQSPLDTSVVENNQSPRVFSLSWFYAPHLHLDFYQLPPFNNHSWALTDIPPLHSDTRLTDTDSQTHRLTETLRHCYYLFFTLAFKSKDTSSTCFRVLTCFCLYIGPALGNVKPRSHLSYLTQNPLPLSSFDLGPPPSMGQHLELGLPDWEIYMIHKNSNRSVHASTLTRDIGADTN